MTDRAAALIARQRSSSEVRLLTALIVLLIAIPSKLIFAPLGSAGTPAQMLGLLLAVLWAVTRVMPGNARAPVEPVRVMMLVFLGAVVASYLAAVSRPIEPLEVSAADRGLLSVLSWFGMFIAAADGLTSRADLMTVLRRLSIAGGCLAALGLVQFVTSMPLVNYIKIPGLTTNADLNSEIDRNGLVRAAGTAIHPIEFGAVLTMILPIALHFAMRDTHRSVLARWWPVAAIAAAVPISISRSAIVSAGVVLLFVLPTWSRQVRWRAYGLIVVLTVWLYLTVPGLIGTLRGLFTGISTDTSTQSRTDSYNLAWDFIGRAPFFGRGFRTFLPSYRILDNQYLGVLIEMGFVGLAAVIGLFVVAVVSRIQLRRRSTDPDVRSMAQALAAAVAATAISFALFDAFSFTMAASLLFLVLGCSSALGRLAREGPDVGTLSASAAPGRTALGR
jgi:O-antigen ligase